MSHAMQIYETGGPEVLRWEEVRLQAPAEGEVLLRQTAVGVNFVDIYLRNGTYPTPSLPFIDGQEACGVVAEVGPGVSEFKPGDRVAYGNGAIGAYAEERLVRANRLILVPDNLTDTAVAAMMLKGLTVQYLLRSTYRVQSGETILIHAAAGGVGLIACQWAKHLGATVIGTVGTEEKARLAAEYGCDFPIIYTKENFVERVHEITDDVGVPVVYDSVGKETFMQSLDCLAPHGVLVSFGQSSGVVPPLDVRVLSEKGSLFLTRPTLNTYAKERAALVDMSRELFDVVGSGAVKVEVRQTFALKEAVEAHRALEGRLTTGSTVLLP